MRPNKIKFWQAAETIGVGGIEALADVQRQAGDFHFAAYVGASAAAGHRVKDVLGAEEKEQVADEPAAAIAGIAAVAVFTGMVEMVKAGQMRHGAGVPGCGRQPGINRLASRDRIGNRGNAATGGVERIDGGCGHGKTP